MLTPITRIPFDDLSEVVPAFGVIALMAFTYNVGVGMTAGFVLYPFCKLVSGRLREVRPRLGVDRSFPAVFCFLSVLVKHNDSTKMCVLSGDLL